MSTISDASQSFAEKVTRYFLYGSDNNPSNLIDESLIRSSTEKVSIDVPLTDYMTYGPGRFALGAQFDLIKGFFGQSFGLPPGEYTKAQIAAHLGLSDYGLYRQQGLLDDGQGDLLSRAYVWASTSFKLSDDVRFVISASGEKTISNFSVMPNLNDGAKENFDWGSNSYLSKVANVRHQQL